MTIWRTPSSLGILISFPITITGMFEGKAITELEEPALSEYLIFFWVADACVVIPSETTSASVRPAANRKDVFVFVLIPSPLEKKEIPVNAMCC